MCKQWDDETMILPRCVSRSLSRTAAWSPRAPSALTSRKGSADRRRSSSHRQYRRQSATGEKTRREDKRDSQIKYDIKSDVFIF